MSRYGMHGFHLLPVLLRVFASWITTMHDPSTHHRLITLKSVPIGSQEWCKENNPYQQTGPSIVEAPETPCSGDKK
jgi:hypothetical protein